MDACCTQFLAAKPGLFSGLILVSPRGTSQTVLRHHKTPAPNTRTQTTSSIKLRPFDSELVLVRVATPRPLVSLETLPLLSSDTRLQRAASQIAGLLHVRDIDPLSAQTAATKMTAPALHQPHPSPKGTNPMSPPPRIRNQVRASIIANAKQSKKFLRVKVTAVPALSMKRRSRLCAQMQTPIWYQPEQQQQQQLAVVTLSQQTRLSSTLSRDSDE